jgi:hypothetical protein
MAAKKKNAKITKAPSGISFMYEPRKPHGALACLDPDCEGHIVEAGDDGVLLFICTGCDWTSPDGHEHEPTRKQFHHVDSTVVKKQTPKKPNVALRNAVRAEARACWDRLHKARKAIKKPTPKLTSADRERLHKLSYSHAEIRDGIKA